MNRYLNSINALFIVVVCSANTVAAEGTLLKDQEQAKAVLSTYPMFHERVIYFSAKPISGSILEHEIEGKEIVLNVGVRDGVRLGHAFQICTGNSTKSAVGVAKVLELERNRCIARITALGPEHVGQSVKGLTTVCAAPKPSTSVAAVEIGISKSVWQTESLAIKLVRAIVENVASDEAPILIRQDN